MSGGRESGGRESSHADLDPDISNVRQCHVSSTTWILFQTLVLRIKHYIQISKLRFLNEMIAFCDILNTFVF